MGQYAVNWFSTPAFVTAFCCLVVGLWVLRRERGSRLGEVVFAGTLLLAATFGCLGMLYLADDSSTALLWARLSHVAVPLLPLVVYLYITVGLRRYQRDKIVIWLTVLISAAFIVTAFATRLLITDVEKYWWGYYPVYGPVGGVLAGYFIVVVVVGLTRLSARMGETVKGSVFSRRILMSLLAGVATAAAAVDFLVAFGLPVYPFGFAPVLILMVLLLFMERRHQIVYLTPAIAANQILATMQGAILVTSPDGVVEVGNRAAAELLGRKEIELVDLPLDEVFASGTEWRTLLQDCLSGGRIDDLETSWKPQSGGTIDVGLSISCVRDDSDRPLGLIFAAVDLTTRKQAEEELRLRDEQLRQSQKMEAVGQLAGGIAHDFNNLLTAIIGNSSLALGSMSPEDPHRPLVADIHEVAERAAVLTRQILAFSRRQMLRPEVLCLGDLIEDMESLLRRTLGEDIELELSLAPDLRDSEIDAQQIGQVILNLVVNARDAMPDGGRLIIETTNTSLDDAYCRVHRETEPGEYVLLAVSDTGHGMDKETQAHLFEPFYTTKGAGRGTGLGLSTVFGIVKQSGGSIAVYSEPGEGTTFKVYLPVVKAPATADDGPAASTVRTGTSNGCANILVVEDETPVRRLVVRVLSRSSYPVMAAASAKEAETIIDSGDFRPDLLLTDIVLPGGVNGRQVAERLLERFPELRVVFMSGYTKNVLSRNNRCEEDATFLEKPFNPEQLLRTIQDMLGQ